MEQKISLEKLLILTDDSVIYITEKFVNFDINKLSFVHDDNVHFQIKYSYSYDNQNWSNPISLSELDNISDFNELIKIDNSIDFVPDVYISIWLTKENLRPNDTTIYIQQNVENTIQRITFDKLLYNNNEIEHRIQTFRELISKYPLWNFYDNQQVTINNWKKQCFAVVQMYGHAGIYFKTEPVEINNTLANNVTRKVVSIKKIMIGFPGNELPIDRNVYSEWDYTLSEDAVSHIVDEQFKQAFGDKVVPVSKDYMYLPILNKLFTVTSVQVGKQYMGQTGWWEVYIAKYEDDETVSMSDSIMDSISGFTDFDDIENMMEEVEIFKKDTVLDKDDILEATIDEKKEATHGFTNSLADSTRFIDLKETEAQREFYDKRLNIVSINPDGNAFPISMYNCETVEKNVVALTYNLLDNVSVNKKSLQLKDKYELSFNFVLVKKFSGNIIELIDVDLPIVSVQVKRTKLTIIDHQNQRTIDVDFDFELMEYYNITLKFDNKLKQFAIGIFVLRNKIKKLEYQNIYINTNPQINTTKFTNIFLYGGVYLINEIFFTLDENRIMSDYTKPILIMQKFN